MQAEAIAFTATVRKEWQVMRRYWPNTVLLLVESLLVPLGYWAQASGFAGGDHRAVDAFASRSGTADVAGFIYLGWAVYLWMTSTIWGPGTSLRKERMQGSLENLFLTPVSRFTVLFGPAVTQLLPAALMFTTVGLMMRFAFGVPLGPRQLLTGLLVVLASIPVLFALGALVALLVLRVRDAAGINGAIRGLTGILCGITFPIAVLPGWVRPVSRALPITQVLDTLRAAVLQQPALADIWSRVLILLSLGIGIGAVTVTMLGLVLRSAGRTGRLGQY
jgi:ABC-2 type transport system permease protein